MPSVDVEYDPTATRCTLKKPRYPKYKDHLSERYKVKIGDGSVSGRWLCWACATPEEHAAIRRERDRIAERKKAERQAEIDRKHRTFPQLYWPWFVTAGGYLVLPLKWWGVSALAGAFALVLFALFAPVPCRSTVDADPEPCDEWARGYLRACEDFKHRQRQTALLRKAARERRPPTLVWDEPMARMAILGGSSSAVLVAIATACYLLTRWF